MKKMMSLLLMLVCITAFKSVEDRIVKGKVTDEKGMPIAGASIICEATKSATVTDASGNFSIKLGASCKTLRVAYIGYESQEIKLEKQTFISVSLKPAKTSLDEVVVVGYSAQRKKYLAGSVAAIQAKNYSGQKSAEYFLQGKAAGLQVSNGYIAMDNNSVNDNRGKIRRSDSTKVADKEFNTEDYDKITENEFLATNNNPLSTFSIDVDAASYSNVRRFINQGQMPPAGAVRIEEMVNYFSYEYPQPTDNKPFSVNTEIANCPWNNQNYLVSIGLQGKKIPVENLPPSNLVFLIDVSGSMMGENRIGLVKSSLKLLVDQLRPLDKVSIVVYAGNAGLVLPTTSGDKKTTIKAAIDNLEAGGSTAGGAGIKLAYKVAKENFKKEGNNRVILCTDGDFNVGISSTDALERMIEEERKSGVFLTVLGYGMGNYKDNRMQILADKGNGNHAYIDGITEAKKVLVNEFGGTLFTIAKDVKLQIEFNPSKVQAYRLIGYENRMLAKEDFNNDAKDAGELGSGHTVTALYEVIPVGVKSDFISSVDALRYAKEAKPKPVQKSDELLFVKLRYKQPDSDTSMLIEHVVSDKPIKLSATTNNFRFAASVAAFGMLLRNSKFKSDASYESVLDLASGAIGKDKEGYRNEFVALVEKVEQLAAAKQ